MGEHALELFTEPHEPVKWSPPLLGECVLGIDPSLLGFAICYSVPGKELVEGRWSSEPAQGVRDRIERYEQLIHATLQIVLAQAPALVLIEGYAMAPQKKKQGRPWDRAELGGILRLELCRRTHCPICEVAPSTLKKFTTGDGKATKPFMVSELARKHDRRFTTDDAADAFALCQLGLALTGQTPPPSTKLERQYLDKLRNSYGLARAA
jgi:Holliday junction resolvasome RuvABC endonuclease subunit